MLFKGNSSKLELLIGKIQANTLGTDPSLSWNSETADEDHSLSPSSCATPNSVVTEGNDPEVNFTIGPTESTPYACQFCEKAFPRLSYLKKHEQSHSDQMPFQCDFCQRLFKHKRSRDRHVKLHTGDKKYRCPHCESAFSRSDHLKIHMKTHDHQKPYQCVICNRGYNTAAALTSHMQNHKKETSVHSTPSPGAFRCLQCTGTFLTGEELQTHVSHHHRPISSSTPEKGEDGGNGKRRSISPKTPSSSPSSRGGRAGLELDHTSSASRLMLPFPMPKLTCIYCTKDSFTTMEALQLHVQAMHGALLNGEFGDSSHHLSSPMSTPPGVGSPETPGSLACNYCTMKFSSINSLHKHALGVHGLSGLGYIQAKAKENAFCAHCALAFPDSLAYAEHFLVLHAHSNPHQQPPHHHSKHSSQVCSPEPPQVNPTDLSKKNKGGDGGSSSSASSGGQTPAKKIKRDEDHERAEMRAGSHSNGSAHPLGPAPGVGVVPALIPNPTLSFGPHSLLCNQCNAGFSDFESFRTHLKSHLEEVVHKFVCDECESEFGTAEQLENHAMIHYLTATTEFGCQSCLKLFGKPDELQKHLMDIHAHHLYRCALCKEMFDSKVSIQVHFAVKHSNECKLFRCNPCTTMFRSELEFQVHVKMAHLRKLSPYRCLLCGASFGNELDLQFHLSTHPKQFSCKFCDEAFHVEFLLDKHMQTHHTTLMNGSTESERESTPHGLSTHPSSNNTTAKSSGKKGTVGNTGNSGKSKDLKCDICDKSLNNEAELTNHRKQVHHILNSNLSSSNAGPVSANSGSGVSSGKGNQKSSHHNNGNHTLSLHCAYCSENCKSRSDLENHMKTHQIVSSGKHKCNICDEVCPTATLLAEHKLTHCKVVSGNVCTGCKQNLYSEEKFYSHMKQHCGGGNPGGNATQLPMPCIVCRQTLMTDIEIQMHAKFHMKQQQNFESSVGNGKSRSSTPKSHIQCCLCHRFEDKVRFLLNGYTNGIQAQTYVCPDCCKKNSPTIAQKLTSPPMPPTSSSSKRSRNSPDHDSRKIQQGIKTNINGSANKKSYQCIKCQMSFASEEEIQSHVTTHMMNEGSSHECHLCHQRFFDSPLKLQCHLIEHTFEGCSSFTCYMCSAVFTTSNGLQQHMVEHGLHARPYDCSHCHLKFFFRAELENHIVTHEEIKRSILERYAATTTAVSDFTKCILNLTTQQEMSGGGRQSKGTSNGHQQPVKNSSNSSQVSQKRKKFFYRSDDSDEEMESHSQSGLSVKTEESESSEKRDLIQRVNNGGSSVSDESMDNNDYGRTRTATPMLSLDDKCSTSNNDQRNGRPDKLNLKLDRDSS